MEIFNLENLPSSKFELVGGKAKGLHLLSKSGIRIAEGFVITGITGEEDLECAARYYENSGLGEVAVRSSANAEDGTDFSNAGQYNTYLNVLGSDHFKKSVVDCLSSLHGKEAVSYAKFFNQAESQSMSIVVQKMVKARKAGVCFTIDPTGDQDVMLIEAVQGLGESLVSGQNSAAQYRIAKQEVQSKNNGSLFVEDDSLLNQAELAKICKDAEQASQFFNMPLDTEWAIDETGELLWLQARPITTSEEVDIHELDSKMNLENEVITSCNIGEMLPGAVTPLSLSTTVNAIDIGLHKMLVAAGAYKSLDELQPQSAALSIGNHLFLNLSTIYALGHYVMGADVSAVELSLCGRVLENKPARVEKQIRKVTKMRKMINGVKYMRFLFSRNKARKKLSKLAKEFHFSHKTTSQAQYEEIGKHVEKINDAIYFHYITSAHSGAMSSALYAILIEDIPNPEEVKFIIAGLLEGIEGIESVDILRSLQEIAVALRLENPDISSQSQNEILHYLKTSKGESNRAYRAFMSKHGHRAIREAEMSSKGWEDDEAGFMAYLRTVLSSEGMAHEKPVASADNLKELKNRYKGLKKMAIGYLAKQARTGVVNRESSKSSSIRIVNELKKAYNRLAELMLEEGRLPDVNLIYFLKHDEIGQLLKEQEAKLVKRALQRKRLYEEQKTLVFNDLYFGRPTPETLPQENAENGAVLKGAPVSRGMATGKARVVKSVEDANKLQKGEIMVAAFTDIGWSPYYCVIEALITEVGSALSHGAVVAREYALPLITNVARATSLIKTGDTITVNGTTGTVTIVEKEE